MARKPRFSPGGLAYHVMNRTPGKLKLFEDDGDYQAFEKETSNGTGPILLTSRVRRCLMVPCQDKLAKRPADWFITF